MDDYMNMNNLMPQAQRMQKDMERKQKEIYESEFVGSSQLVEITIKRNKIRSNICFDADEFIKGF